MSIDYLAHHPEFIPTLAQESLDHYRDILRDETLETRCAKLRSHMNTHSLPLTLVAFADGDLFGMGALREHDLPGQEQFAPWLGGVFVRPQHRRRGVGSALCRALEEKAWLMGFPVLYLFTLDQQRLYARLGWQHVRPSAWLGHPVYDTLRQLVSARFPGRPLQHSCFTTSSGGGSIRALTTRSGILPTAIARTGRNTYLTSSCACSALPRVMKIGVDHA